MAHVSQSDQSPSQITLELVQLEELVNDALLQSVRALIEHDEMLARKVSLGDETLNRLRYQIEEHCYAALEQAKPSTDPRAMVATVNVVTNLERIGDYAARIAYLTHRLLFAKVTYPVPSALPVMVEVARELVEGAVEAYLSNNDLLAERIVRRDRELMELYERVCQELVQTDSTRMIELLPLSWIAIQLERVGERAISICERTIYVSTGELKEFR